MALFMDVHDIAENLSFAAVVGALMKDRKTQAKYQVSYLRRWACEEQRKIFCLVEADNADDARAVHLAAHGHVADEIYPVCEVG